jgi:hypothetical protein
MSDEQTRTLGCGCIVKTHRDFLGRVVGTVQARGDRCTHEGHDPGQVVIMPGREHARPE